MVSHDIAVQGLTLAGVAQAKPVLLQMNQEDFPSGFMTTLAASKPAAGSAITALTTSTSTPVTLYQPVQRIVHVAMLQLSCNSVGSPRLDPTRVESAGVVIRRIVQKQGVNQLDASPSAWMTASDGSCQWTALNGLQESLDPDPGRRPQLQSGQAGLDQLLALQTLSNATTETSSPAFVAPPATCNAAGRTIVYAVLPTASSEVSTNPPIAPQYDARTLAASLPTLLQPGAHTAPLPDRTVDSRYMSDEFARANDATGFLTFSLTLRMLYSVFSAFDDTAPAQSLIAALNKHNVYLLETDRKSVV